MAAPTLTKPSRVIMIIGKQAQTLTTAAAAETDTIAKLGQEQK